MNGRTARKLLWRNRITNFWGRRAYFTVRIPLSVLPEQPPVPAGYQDINEYLKSLESRFEGDLKYKKDFHQVSGGDPRKRDDKRGYSPPYAIEREDSWDDREWYQWWEGAEKVWEKGTTQLVRMTPLPEEEVLAYAAYNKWVQKYVHLDGWPNKESPLRDLVTARWWSRTTYGDIHHGYLYLTFSVKWFYVWRRKEFVRAISRVFKSAKKAGIRLRAMKTWQS